MVYEGYCTIAQIKSRLNIAVNDFDTELESAGTEASRLLDERIRPYKSDATVVESKEPFVFNTIPLTPLIIPDLIKEICADYGAGLFKRRQQPQRFDQGWLNQASWKLNEYIKNNWHKGRFEFAGV